jgi:hypothetical protein
MGHKWGIQKLETQPSQFRGKSRLYGCEWLSLSARAAGHTLPVHRLLNLALELPSECSGVATVSEGPTELREGRAPHGAEQPRDVPRVDPNAAV